MLFCFYGQDSYYVYETKFYNIYKLYEKLHIDVLSKRGQPKTQKLKYVSAAFGDGFSLKLLIVLLTLSAMVCVTANSLQIYLSCYVINADDS